MDGRKLRNLARILRAEGVSKFSDGTITLEFAARFEAAEPVMARPQKPAPQKPETPEDRRAREIHDLRVQLDLA